MSSKILAYLIWLLVLVKADFVNAQNPYQGKILVAKINETCKERTNGGCTIISFCVLKFGVDSVEVDYPVRAYCTTKEDEILYNSLNKKSTSIYTFKANKLGIRNFKDFELYTFQEQTVQFLNSIYR